MKKLNSNHNLSNKHLYNFLLESYVFLFEIEIDIPPRQIFHHDVYFVLILEGLPDPHKQLIHTYLAN